MARLASCPESNRPESSIATKCMKRMVGNRCLVHYAVNDTPVSASVPAPHAVSGEGRTVTSVKAIEPDVMTPDNA